MDILLNPNVAYLILAFGLMVTVLALLSPGTGFLELGAVLILALVAWLVINLGFNWWALLLILIGFSLFVLAVRYPRQPAYLVAAIIALLMGSIFLFPREVWFIPAVNPFLAAIVSVLLTGFFWIVTHKVLESRQAPPVQDLESLIGKSGEAKSDIQDEGTVLIGSELWSARSTDLIARGERVKVIDREGYILVVQSDNMDEPEVKS
jgi:membrane-bound serine protease (ClpP class)